jgi:proteic killer suppression protein
LKRLVENDEVKGLPADKIGKIRNVLAALILAEDSHGFMADAPPGWRIHRLSGDRQRAWSISVSGNWRITFDEVDGEIEHLNLEDYH